MKRKILVIEDNEQNLYLIRFILEDGGYEVLSAKDGREGVEMAATRLPDLILLDIQLPDMDGYTTARALRENADLNRTPIVAVTSYAMPGDREKALASGFSGYIEKPIDPDTFEAQVSQYIAAKNRQRSRP
ncbi:MAG: response regulator [Deltaproteobacteria bacterium]|nr:response regulator [Deltaproteobacteria bacterium]